MRKRLALLILLPSLCHATEGDWGYAHINFIKASLAENWSILSRSQVTRRNDLDDFYFWYADVGIAYSISSAWRAELAYRHAEWNFGNRWQQERRPMVNLDWFGKMKGIRLSHQARLEYRDFQWNRDPDWRIRNRTRIEPPWTLKGISPYVEEEFFFSHNRGELEMNWLTAGLQLKPIKGVKLKTGYRWIRIRTGDDWENRNQLLTGLALFF